LNKSPHPKPEWETTPMFNDGSFKLWVRLSYTGVASSNVAIANQGAAPTQPTPIGT